MQVDLEDDRFVVTFDAKLAQPQQLVAAIKAAGFDAVVVAATTNRDAAADEPEKLDQSKLPDDLVALLTQAAAANKAILLRFTGPD